MDEVPEFKTTESSESSEEYATDVAKVKRRAEERLQRLQKEKRKEEKEFRELEKKYKIDPELVTEITINQLPRDLKMEDLSAYLSEKYHNQYVKIYHSPLSQYGPFLPEVISNILKSNDRYLPSATLISKSVRRQAMVSYLNIECQKPIFKSELLKYLRKNHAIALETNESGIIMFWYKYYNGDIDVNTFNTYELDWSRTPGYKSVGQIYNFKKVRPILIKDINTNVDMFSEYNILTRRKKCNELDKNYALKKLLQIYNNTIAGELRVELREKDVERVFYMEKLTHMLGLIKDFHMQEDRIDLFDQKKVKEFLEPIFKRSRLLIRHKIVSEHKVEISPYNEFILDI